MPSEASSSHLLSIFPAPEYRPTLKRRLLGLMGARLLFSTLLMGSTVIYQLSSVAGEDSRPTGNFVFWLVGAIYFLTILYGGLFSRVEKVEVFALVQLCLDLVLLTLLMLATGCQDSVFLFCYLLLIIAAAVVLRSGGAFFFALYSLFGLAFLLMGNYFELYKKLAFVRSPETIEGSEVAYTLLVYGSSFFIVALLSGRLDEQLQATEKIVKKQQIDIDNLEAIQRDIVMSLNSGLMTTNIEGEILFLNPYANDLCGGLWPAVKGKDIHDLLPRLSLSLVELVGSSARVEVPFFRESDQAEILLGLSVSMLRDHLGEKSGYLVLFQDLTPIKKIEEIARRNEKMASLGEIAARMAHEIRNPLSSLSGSIQLLGDGSDISRSDRKLMEIMRRETARLDSLLGDFLRFAKPKPAQKSRYKLKSLVLESSLLFQQDERFRNCTICEDIEEHCEVSVDGGLFQQVVWNLLVNAGQAMQPDGGRIWIEVEQCYNGVSLLLLDEGPGIPESERSHIFEPFYSTKERGTGLGLSIVQRIVSEHDGDIEFYDESERRGLRLFFPAEPFVE